MLREDVRRAALKAAAKVAMSMTMLGCAASADSDTGINQTSSPAEGNRAGQPAAEPDQGSTPSPYNAPSPMASASASAPAPTAGTMPQPDPAPAPSSTTYQPRVEAPQGLPQLGQPPPSDALCGAQSAKLDDEQAACCEAELASLVPPDFAIDQAPLPTSMTTCCGGLVARHDASFDAGTAGESKLSYYQLSQCCQLLDPMPIGPTCTPWGPPMPPSMSDDGLWLEVA